VVACNLDVELDARESGNVAALAQEAFRVCQSVCRRINLFGLLLDVVKKADK
jgi:hypothetical protein